MPVLLEALGTTPGLLATCLSFTSLFILSVTLHHLATSYGLSLNLTASGRKAGEDSGTNPSQL